MILKRAVRMGGTALLVFGLASACFGVSGAADQFRAELTTDGKAVVVKNEITGRVVHTIAKPPGLVRRAFALDGGAVVATTTKDATEFWNATDGTLTRRIDERVHAVSHSGNRVVTFAQDRALLVRSYPDLDLVRVLESHAEWGPSGVVFSPNDRYVAVEFCNHYPLTDEQFANPVFDATLYRVKIYDVQSGETLPAVSDVRIGKFSPDSRYYEYQDGRRFDLRSRSLVTPRDEGGAR